MEQINGILLYPLSHAPVMAVQVFGFCITQKAAVHPSIWRECFVSEGKCDSGLRSETEEPCRASELTAGRCLW